MFHIKKVAIVEYVEYLKGGFKKNHLFVQVLMQLSTYNSGGWGLGGGGCLVLVLLAISQKVFEIES